MSGYDIFSLTSDQMTRLANQVMELLESRAHEDGLLSSDQEFSKRYTIVLAKKGVFSQLFDKLFLGDSDSKQAYFVILDNPTPLESEETE